MYVQITRQCMWQDAGRERVLAVGSTHDLSSVVAQSLIDLGSAIPAPCTADQVVPERKPLPPLETKRRSRA